MKETIKRIYWVHQKHTVKQNNELNITVLIMLPVLLPFKSSKYVRKKATDTKYSLQKTKSKKKTKKKHACTEK